MRGKRVRGRARWVILLAAAALACDPSREASHPLDPLSASEMDVARGVLTARGVIGGGRRVVMLDLREPPKADVLAARPVAREARAVLYDARRNQTSEAVVNVSARRLESWHAVADAQAPLDAADGALADTLVGASAPWRAALARRGLRPGDVFVGAWSAGYFGVEDAARGRLVRAVPYVRAAAGNEMARPVEGVVALVDLSGRRVVRVDDADVGAVPDASSERAAWLPLPPPATTTPAAAPWGGWPVAGGAAPRVDGHAVRWRRWRLRFGVRPREGLVLYDVGFDDGARVRSVMYRASLSEMVVPYGDPGAGWYFRNSFDVGELGLGAGTAALTAGVDCPESAALADAVIADARGAPRRLPRAVCVFERDGGLAWKHGDAARRARELVLLYVSRLGNYDYGFEWAFHEDGTIAHRVLLTGVMAAKGMNGGGDDSLAHRVAGGVAAVHHQHFFNYRLDLDVDGAAPNEVEEAETHALADGPGNPYGGGFAMRTRVLASERQAQRRLDLASNRHWLVVHPAVGAGGRPTAYALIPGANAVPFASDGSWLRRRAGFLDAHLWATPYADDERYAAGDYPNQSRGGDGLARWTAADRPLAGDVVLWYTLGVTHNPRPEDWPVMPIHAAGFSLVPVGFFDRNPVLDRP